MTWIKHTVTALQLCKSHAYFRIASRETLTGSSNGDFVTGAVVMIEKSDISTSPNDWWSAFYRPVQQFGQQVAEFFSPSSDAAVAEDFYEINVELPGVSGDDISVEAHDGRLSITGEKKSNHEESGKNYYFSERTYGTFRRSFRLPADADVDNVSATHKDGVLTIRVAKERPSKATPRKISINQG